jgi:predicted neuraminidase
MMAATCEDVGKKWSKPIAIQGPKGTRIGDPLPWIDPKGRLWLFYTQLTEKTESTPLLRATFAVRADDPTQAAPQWSTPFVVAPDGILFGKPIIRQDGAWIAPFFINGPSLKNAEIAGRETGTLISTDEGATWKWLGGASIPKNLLNFSEATLAQRKDNSLWMVIRTSVGLYESASKDGGKTWGEAAPIPGFEKGPSTRACMRRLASGAFMLVYHDAPPNKNGGYGRSRMTVWLSDDEAAPGRRSSSSMNAPASPTPMPCRLLMATSSSPMISVAIAPERRPSSSVFCVKKTSAPARLCPKMPS